MDKQQGKYDDVLRPFVALMEAELHANAGKGDRPGWLSMTRQTALLEIYYHVAKLQKAAKDDDAALIREHAADVANMAMMLLDVCGGLPTLPQSPRESGEREPVAWRYKDARGKWRYTGPMRPGFSTEYSILKPEPLYTVPSPAASADEWMAEAERLVLNLGNSAAKYGHFDAESAALLAHLKARP